MSDAIERAQALLASLSALKPYDHPDVMAEHSLLRTALSELLAEVSELTMLRDVEAGHVEEIVALRERAARWKALAKRLFAFRSLYRRTAGRAYVHQEVLPTRSAKSAGEGGGR